MESLSSHICYYLSSSRIPPLLLQKLRPNNAPGGCSILDSSSFFYLAHISIHSSFAPAPVGHHRHRSLSIGLSKGLFQGEEAKRSVRFHLSSRQVQAARSRCNGNHTQRGFGRIGIRKGEENRPIEVAANRSSKKTFWLARLKGRFRRNLRCVCSDLKETGQLSTPGQNVRNAGRGVECMCGSRCFLTASLPTCQVLVCVPRRSWWGAEWHGSRCVAL